MTRYRRRPVAATPVDGELFLVCPGDEIFHLNALGAALWRLLAEPTGESELCDLLAAAFPEAPPEALARDVAAFLERLRARDLVEALPG